MGSNVNWKPEEIEYLEINWGLRSLDAIAEGLGRSPSGVNQKAQRLGLGDPLLHLNGITINALSVATNIEYGLIFIQTGACGCQCYAKYLCTYPG